MAFVTRKPHDDDTLSLTLPPLDARLTAMGLRPAHRAALGGGLWAPMQNMIDGLVSGLAYWTVGYGFAYGTGGGSFIGV